jgi:tetratricopeptide (TPR) repeat protein
LAVPAVSGAQLARQPSNERLLVLAPVVRPAADSEYSIQLADAIRDRMATKYRFQFLVIPTEKICEALEASGFSCGAPLPQENASALARFLQVTAYIVGWLQMQPDSTVLTLRMVDAAGSGLTGWERFTVPVATPANSFGQNVADGLDGRIRAAERARSCNERRSRGDSKGAIAQAQRAFEMYPNHTGAALCLELVYELEHMPVDSLVTVLTKAASGDSLNVRAWEDLSRRLLEKGDTAGALNASIHQLRAEPTDQKLRQAVVAALIILHRNEDAVGIADEGLASNPGDVVLLSLKERACLEGTMWRCALQTLDQEAQIDTSLAADSIFYQKIFGAAQSIPDTAAMVRWSGRGVERFPSSVSLWRARAAALKAADDRAGALGAYQRLLALDSTQIGSALAAAQLLLDSTLVIDTAVPLDTTRLREGERMLLLVARQTTDTVTLMNVASMLYNPAAKLTQSRVQGGRPIAIRFLEESLRYDVRGALRVPANFFLGLAYYFDVADGMEKLGPSKSCELLQTKFDAAQRGSAALTIGRPISAQLADQLLPYLNGLVKDLPKYKAAWKCP